MEKSMVIKGTVTFAVILLVGSILFVEVGIPQLPVPLPFEEIEQGFYCGLRARVNYVITDNDTWNTLWMNMNNISTGYPDLPFVNFTNEAVIAVFLGEFSTGGYVAEITDIIESGDKTTVNIREQHPGAGCGVTMAFTQPYHIVKVLVDLSQPVEFVYTQVIYDCP